MRLTTALLFLAITVPLFGKADIAALEARVAKGDAAAQNELGALYQAGDGVPRDEAKALSLYRSAAETGHTIAAYNLAFMYDMGMAMARDRVKANAWYLKSAEAGYPPAMLNLGMNIAGGEGVLQDFIEGMKWLDLARFFTQKEKDKQVKYRIREAYDYLKKQMSTGQIQEAERKSKAWYKEFQAKQMKG